MLTAVVMVMTMTMVTNFAKGDEEEKKKNVADQVGSDFQSP